MRKFFIVGCPRSGTTVLQQALNRYTAIVVPPETKYFDCFYGKSAKQQVAHLKQINAGLELNVVASKRGVRAPDEGAAFFETMAGKARALEPIGTNRIGVWRRELWKRQVGRLERRGARPWVILDTRCASAQQAAWRLGLSPRWGGVCFAA